jgi:hypothetical protein
MTEPRPSDAWSPGAFQGPNGWQPPQLVRLAVWLVKDVGVPVVLSGILIAVVLGWVDSPLTRIGHLEVLIQQHVSQTDMFQRDLLEGLRRQRCLMGLTSVLTQKELIAATALAENPCTWLEHFMRATGRP